MASYRRPGVYLEESLLVNPSDVAGTVTVGCFVGVAAKGQLNEPVLIESWSDYVTLFGGFDPIQPPTVDPNDRTVAALGPLNFANLAALKADPTVGDTHYTGPAFDAGDYVTLLDASKAHVTGTAGSSVWTVGATTGTPDALVVPPKVLSYLPYAVYSFFQNGGRFCWVIRSAPTSTGSAGTASSIAVNGAITGVPNLTSFTVTARSVGTWGNNLKYSLATQGTIGTGGSAEDVFALQILLRNSDGEYETVETFTALSVTGTPSGSRRVDSALNDLYSGSRYVRITGLNSLQMQPQPGEEISLAGGIDPGIPDVAALRASALKIGKVEGPINLNIAGYINDISKLDTSQVATAWVSTTLPGSSFTDREDVLVINDSAPPRLPNQDSSSYNTTIQSTLGANLGDSYSASYSPWIIIPDPRRVGTTLYCPPGGAVMGMMARIDATVGVFRAPAGVIAGLANAVGVQTKFTDSEMGDLNSKNINVIRSVVGSGICVMGGRTRKSYGADKYISARRTLISIKESLRRSTQWAVFENNDTRLWSGLRLTAERILRPMWESGGLSGTSAAEAYYIRCDATLNTPAVIQSGEVRMEIGVALEYPAEFVVIRITQFDRGSFTSEISPAA
jgi:Bacteriophage tail sheath protein